MKERAVYLSMDFDEGKEKFITAWGSLGSSWGINRTMAQIHALLLISPESLTTEDIMTGLKISRGNVNMNVRALIDWGLVEKDLKTGERKEFFKAEKDVWVIAKQVSRERQRREIEPIMKVLNEIQSIDKGPDVELNEFKKITANLNDFTKSVNGVLGKFVNSDQTWFYKFLMKLK